MADGLASWADARAGRTGGALRRLQLLSPAPKPGRVMQPFGCAEKVYKAVGNERINAGIRAAPVVRVPLAGIVGVQHSVDPHRVAAYIRDPGMVPEGATNPRTGTPVDKPIVVRYQGRDYLHDGHHRATAHRLLGEDSIEARLVDLDEAAA